ncbi:tRNA-intron endonuclease [Cryptococcus amylolentus CBS 6039]|uniref:tRNA-splicing endonuclease subunit Sen2 n=2 Tax=Cryptococcus amylolentus TaxID=104669 RepID=A0A1E3I6N1_9TREE|nr:tRNA-intron endonuclease [Cryptococcus amylolentus CBS 6039]ODN84299.1 tRNA-intron endonuclease [Cryptococcus amylolentus CBS 6039]ODO11866.1 tRNA-intron endonuclease [Cryptococcus amylolentus CBS 6273]
MATAAPQKTVPPRARHAANNRKYGTPLPILFPQPQSTTASVLSSYLPSFAAKAELLQAVGDYDPITQSVWVTDRKGMDLLFQKGFFGKGTLSRSEPSWRERRVALLKGGDALGAEQMREKRRLERKQFKQDRAQAMLDAAKKAEAIVAAAKAGAPVPLEPEEDEQEEDLEGGVSLVVDASEDVSRPASPSPSVATTTTAIDHTNVTAQTFLVRPTRPDANRNRGRNAFRRRPPPAQAQTQTPGTAAAPVERSPPPPVEEDDEEEDDLFDESLVEEMEHLQLSAEEAIFCSLAIGALRVRDPSTQDILPPGPALLSLLLPPPSPTPFPSSIEEHRGILLPDNPVLVSYVVYHHFRSLGWVVKDGIKFCCDWLLYRRGPVFSHSAFACVVIPVYSDPEDQAKSPYGKEDWYDERLSWKWMNTVIRVNALVQKNVIAIYVTIPSLSEFTTSKLADGTLDPKRNDLKALLQRYTVREVSLTRFGATRRRD